MYVKEDVHGFSTVTGQREGYRCVGRRSEVTGIHISERRQEDKMMRGKEEKRIRVTVLVRYQIIICTVESDTTQHMTTHDTVLE